MDKERLKYQLNKLLFTTIVIVGVMFMCWVVAHEIVRYVESG